VAVVISPDSDLAKELAKWEQTPAQRAALPHYPAMLYRAQEKQGRPVVSDPEDAAFSQRCQHVVANEQERILARGQGWYDTPMQALAAYEALQKAYADEAANTAYHAAHMSEKAQREYKAASEATHEHVVDLQPTKAKHAGGRPKKIRPVTISKAEE
jgi:hypothetical protein